MKRRRFLGTAAKATAALSTAGLATRAAASESILGANDRVTVGWIGCGGRGRFVAGHLLDVPSVEITAVCDVFDALTSERPYKKAWSVEEAVAELIKCKNSQFDPQLVDLFIQHLPLMIEIKENFADAEAHDAYVADERKIA